MPPSTFPSIRYLTAGANVHWIAGKGRVIRHAVAVVVAGRSRFSGRCADGPSRQLAPPLTKSGLTYGPEHRSLRWTTLLLGRSERSLAAFDPVVGAG